MCVASTRTRESVPTRISGRYRMIARTVPVSAVGCAKRTLKAKSERIDSLLPPLRLNDTYLQMAIYRRYVERAQRDVHSDTQPARARACACVGGAVGDRENGTHIERERGGGYPLNWRARYRSQARREGVRSRSTRGFRVRRRCGSDPSPPRRRPWPLAGRATLFSNVPCTTHR